jgi:transcriptional regulator with XRE-family HTH domain
VTNERLRSAILTNGLGLQGVADELDVDRKTVERWISGRRVPYRRHQFALASLLGRDVSYLWPDARSTEEATAAGQAEVLQLFPHRSAVPDELWLEVFERATEYMDVLVYSGTFLAESADFHKLLRRKSKAGVSVRMLLGDSDSPAVARRGDDEGIGATGMASRINNAIVNYSDVLKLRGVEFRTHGTVLYNSIYRSDDEMLVNTHVQGVPAYLAPVLHLRHVPGADLFSTYVQSFDRVWDGATPVAAKKQRAA